MKYKNIHGYDLSILEQRVQDEIDLGWKPLGGVQIIQGTTDRHGSWSWSANTGGGYVRISFVQTMIKEKIV